MLLRGDLHKNEERTVIAISYFGLKADVIQDLDELGELFSSSSFICSAVSLTATSLRRHWQLSYQYLRICIEPQSPRRDWYVILQQARTRF